MNFEIKAPGHEEFVCGICKEPIKSTAMVEMKDCSGKNKFYHYLCFTEEAKRKNCRSCPKQMDCNGFLDECSETERSIISKETIMKDLRPIFDLNTDIRNVSLKDGLANFYNYKSQTVITVDIRIFYRVSNDNPVEDFVAYRDWYKEND